MVVEEFKKNSTIIKIDDRDIVTNEKSKELDILLSIISKRYLEYIERK